MSTVIMQARDWGDWYHIKGWLDENAPGSYRLVHAMDSMPAAFEYPAEHQPALMKKLYGSASPDAGPQVITPPAEPQPEHAPPTEPSDQPDQADQPDPGDTPEAAPSDQPVVKRTARAAPKK